MPWVPVPESCGLLPPRRESRCLEPARRVLGCSVRASGLRRAGPRRRALPGAAATAAPGVLRHALPARRSDRDGADPRRPSVQIPGVRQCGSQASVWKWPWSTGRPARGNALHLYRGEKKCDPSFQTNRHSSTLTPGPPPTHGSVSSATRATAGDFAAGLGHGTQKPRSQELPGPRRQKPQPCWNTFPSPRHKAHLLVARCGAELGAARPQQGDPPG